MKEINQQEENILESDKREAMVDFDDDMPPPLEDMSAQVAASQARKQAHGQATTSSRADEDDGEEIRLVPKKKPE